MTHQPNRRGLHGIAWLLAVLAALAGAGAWAGQPARTGTPSAAELTAGIKETILPNGLKVLTKEARSAPVVSFSVWYRAGSRNERTGITGVSHLLEHMLFKGTKKYALGEISRILFVNGASFNASTYYDWTNYYQTLAADRLELAMEIEADRMVNSRIDKTDLDSEMSVVRSELEGGENSPDRLLYQAVSAAAFEAHPYQWPIIGWRTDVENVPRDAINRYYKSHYGPNNATVVIVGDFKTADALTLVRKHFGALKPIPKPPPVYTQEAPQRGERRVTVRRPGSLPLVMIAFKNAEAKHADMYALDALQMVLGEGRTSRLYQGLVEKGIAASASASNASLRDPFLFMLSGTARPGVTADRVEKALLDEAERVKEAPVSDAELTRAKSKIEADFVFRNNSVTEQANQIGFWAVTDDWRYLTTYVDRIRALTPADLQRVARKYLVAETRTVGQFLPSAQAAGGGPPPREASARVEPPKRGDRPVPLPKPSPVPAAKRAVTRFKLDNGLSVVVQENPSNPTLAFRGSLPAGTVLNPREKPGLAQLTAAMLTRGTEKLSALEFASQLEDVGASLSASSDTLATNISGQAQSKDFDRLVDLLGEMLLRPAFPAEDLERLKGQLLAGLEEEKDDPASLADRAFQRQVYPAGNPLRPPTLEEAQKGVTSITRDDLLAFYRKQYGPDRMILVVTGAVRADRVRAALQSRLGSWPKNPAAAAIPPLEVPQPEKAAREVIRVPDKSETAIIWGHAGGLKRSDPDFYAAQVLNMILGGGGALNSRLGTVVRDQQGLAYDVGSFFDASLYPGPFQVSLGTNPANAEKAVRSVEAEVKRIREQGVTQREVDESVAYLTGRFPLRLETNQGLAEVLWIMEFYTLGPDYIEKYPTYYRAVTVAAVNEAAKRHIHPDRAALVLAGTVP